MSEVFDRLTKLSPKRLALLAMQMQSRLDALERAHAEPIAIIGLGCRFPGGADDPESFWQLLDQGIDAVREVPADRWDVDAYYDADLEAPGKMATRWGGFLETVSDFDASFFGISPREAVHMDPQQRLLLEVAWEALEHAGRPPERLQNSSTGVFVGLCNSDYAQMLHDLGQASIDAYMASGSAHSVAAGRLSYFLGLQGPSIAVDTACSSSLVAVHLAVQSLRANECGMALAGGVNLILTPRTTIALSKARMMAPDGRCKAFDVAANGFVRGEGCGVVVLKRLADAQADSDHVWAVIRGSAVNQDGRSNGLTAPNGPAQEAIIRAALANANVEPHDVGYVETHGTGTSLGDPIEVQALGAVLGAGRAQDNPLRIGSVKTNIGHLEAAAGVAGLIKVVLALHRGAIPPHLHLQRPSPHIPWDRYPIAVPTEVTAWPAGPCRRIASVSSFGFSGTNAHLVVEEAAAPMVSPVSSTDSTVDRPMHLLPLSARSGPALEALVARYRDHLAAHPDVALADLCASAAIGRSHFSHRFVVRAANVVQLQERLGALSSAETSIEAGQGVAKGSRRPDIAYLFTGQGAQYPGMARTLYATQPTFRQALDRCADLLAGALDRPLLDVIFDERPFSAGNEDTGASRPLDQTAYTQPALFAVEYALTELWRSWGIAPSAVLGHSVGEYVAAHIAGVFSLEDGLKLIAARGRLMQRLAAGGVMVALTAAPERVAEAIAPFQARASIAAINGPASTVISGEAAAVAAVCGILEAEGVRQRPLTVSHAFHSPLMEPVLAAFDAIVRGVTFSLPRIPFVSNLTGTLAGHEVTDPAYWVRHIREPVQFAGGMETLRNQGCTLFLEIGPHPVLLGLGRQCLPDGDNSWLPSLRQGRSDWEQMLDSLGALYMRGIDIDWDGFERDYPRQRVSLPTYPFQRDRYWIEREPQQIAPAAGRNGSVRPQAAPDSLPRSTQSQIGAWLYEIVWRAAGELTYGKRGDVPAAVFESSQIGQALHAAIAPLAERFGLASYQDLLPQLDRACSAYVLRALRDLGWTWTVGDTVDPELLIARLRIEGRHRRLVGRMLTMLAEDGYLSATGETWVVERVPIEHDPEALMAALQERYPAHRAELDLTTRCARELAMVLRGQTDPLQLLFPQGSFQLMEDVYQRSPASRLYNTLIGEAVATAISQIPHGRPIRILEIGGGTGSTSASVMAILPADRTTYVFTDISPLFTSKAQRKFQAFPFVQYRVLDIGRDPEAQGLEPGHFDIVLAANVLHATPDIRRTLRHVRSLLAPAGLLIMLEGTAPQRFGDLTVGLTEGWWSFSDADLRAEYALMNAAQWRRALAETGFADLAFVPEESQSSGTRSDQAVILARAPHVVQPLANATPRATEKGLWLIFADRGGLGRQVAEQLGESGAQCAVALASHAYARIGADEYALNPTQPDDFRQLLHALIQPDQPPLRGIVHLWSLDAPLSETMTIDDLQASQALALASVLHLAQALAAERPDPTTSLWLVTKGAQAADSAAPLSASQAGVWGLGNVIALEHPELRCRLLDLDPAVDTGHAAMLTAELLQPDGRENQIALRGTTRYVRRLAPYAGPVAPGPGLMFRTEATYLITGGLGGLGLLVAEWMVDKGARHVVLMARSEAGPEARAVLMRLEQTGADVVVAQGDVAQRADVERVLDMIDRRGRPLAGVIHAAGVLDDGVLLQQRWERFTRVLAAKVEGSWNLHALTRHLELDFFTLFSSGASLLGARGQSNHAAANAFEDALAHYRRRQGLPALSINWGPWSDIGAVVKRNVGARIAAQGMEFISPQRGLEALELLMRLDKAQVAVLPAGGQRLWERLHRDAMSPLLEELVTPLAPAKDGPAFADAFAIAAAEERVGLIVAELQRLVGAALGMGPVDVPDPAQPLSELGFDSLMAVELKTQVETRLGAVLPAAIFLEGPSIAVLAEHVTERLAAPAATTQSPTPTPAESGGGRDTVSSLTSLDQLSDDEVNTMLYSLLAERGPEQ